jgi:hypothetical protein
MVRLVVVLVVVLVAGLVVLVVEEAKVAVAGVELVCLQCYGDMNPQR